MWWDWLMFLDVYDGITWKHDLSTRIPIYSNEIGGDNDFDIIVVNSIDYNIISSWKII